MRFPDITISLQNARSNGRRKYAISCRQFLVAKLRIQPRCVNRVLWNSVEPSTPSQIHGYGMQSISDVNRGRPSWDLPYETNRRWTRLRREPAGQIVPIIEAGPICCSSQTATAIAE